MTSRLPLRPKWLFLAPPGALAVAAALLLALPAPSPTSASELIPAPPPTPMEAAEASAPPPVLLPLHQWLKPGEYAWDESAPASGPVRIVADLRARTLSVYRGGREIGRSFITYGTDEKPTPLGRFKILQKDADHVSNLYDSPMPFMLRLTNDGVAIHGGEIADDIATRGCIGVPTEFAKLLFRQAQLGGEVLIVKGPPEGGRYTAYAALPL